MAYSTKQNTENSRVWRERAWTTLITAMGGKCQACDYVGPRQAYDLHHVSPNTKEKTVSVLIAQRNWKRVTDEARKCVLVCCRCHREIHAGARDCPPIVPFVVPEKLTEYTIVILHGTNNDYATRGCRCDACKAAHAEYEHRRRRGAVA